MQTWNDAQLDKKNLRRYLKYRWLAGKDFLGCEVSYIAASYLKGL